MLVNQLKAFFAVARLGSITLAAKQLGLSQPTVTTQIRALEEQYGVELFHRGGGRLTPSDAGRRLLPQVDALLQQELDVEFALRNSAELQGGTLRLGATAPYYTLTLVQRFRSRHPRVELSIAAGNSRQMVDALLAYQVDLATSSHREEDPRLHRVELGSDPLVLLLPRGHALARRQAVPLGTLAQETLLVRERGSMTRTLSEQALDAAGVRPRSQMEIASREALREAVVRGLGVSVFAAHETGRHPDLVALPFEQDMPLVREYLYCLQERKAARLIEAMLGCVGEERLNPP
ncbi:LysR family transcriptional regulator [Roseateles aquatilis]|uniref:LysR family transcriptional regulator n=1 Tax=Roseateles aquatilis TaxID=431061 RepID=A0A246J7V1_9BURK|nr:LysR substrate-binding domain-containing protein [Roseateles aquatilis]OWQ88715.1 LysR family transcriptional regulator [Roseateles aquatilis]